MTKSTITREQLLEIIETDHVQCGEASYLARMALAAMESEPVAVVEPSDYVTAAQLVGEGPARKAVHELYEGALRIGDKLYRHAQPAPEKYNIGDATMRHIFTPTGMTNVSDMQAVFDRVEAVLVGMDQPAPVVPAVSDDIGEIRVGRLPTMNQDDYPGLGDWWVQLRIGEDSDEVLARVYGASPQEANNRAEALACRAAMLQAGNSPAQSDCCPAQNHVSPEQNGDTPAKNQGWIPVSERMPPSRHEVLVGRWWGEKPRWCCKWATYIPGHPDSQSSGLLIPGASWTPTHWMPLPAAPQEVR